MVEPHPRGDSEQTIGDVVSEEISDTKNMLGTAFDAAGSFLGRNKAGLGVAALTVAGMALGQGFVDPLPSGYISNPNFVAPGQDFYWGIKAYWMGVASTAMADVYLHPVRDAAILAAGPVVQAVGRAIGAIKIRR